MAGQVIEGLGTSLTIGSAVLCFVTLGAPGMDGGDPLDATCLDNTEWVTKLPQTLKDVPDISFTARFNPQEWDGIVSEINVNQLITIVFDYQGVDLGEIAFYGYLRSFTPDAGARGEVWNASGVIVVTNMNGSNVETGPNYTA